MSKDSILRILIVVGILYASLLVIIIIFFSLSAQAFSGIFVSYYPVVMGPGTEQTPVSLPVSQTTTPTKVTKTVTVQSSKFGGQDIVVTADFNNDVILTDYSTSTGVPIVGVKATGQDVDIDFSVPYEGSDLKYTSKVKIGTTAVSGDIYRLTTSDGTVFYSNTFDAYNEGMLMCNIDTGDSADCSRGLLSNTTESSSTVFLKLTCNLTSEVGLKNCDDIVMSIKF